jgi:cell wall-associated NlpC family hydrolase
VFRLPSLGSRLSGFPVAARAAVCGLAVTAVVGGTIVAVDAASTDTLASADAATPVAMDLPVRTDDPHDLANPDVAAEARRAAAAEALAERKHRAAVRASRAKARRERVLAVRAEKREKAAEAARQKAAEEARERAEQEEREAEERAERAERAARAERAEARERKERQRSQERRSSSRSADRDDDQSSSSAREEKSEESAGSAHGDVVSIAASRIGMSYVYGGDGPTSFDCSGLTQWAFAKVGISLPHSSAAQRNAVRRISSSEKRPGDLVFVHEGGGGSVSHVAIYAGNGNWIEAANPRSDVRKGKAWTSNVSYGRP